MFKLQKLEKAKVIALDGKTIVRNVWTRIYDDGLIVSYCRYNNQFHFVWGEEEPFQMSDLPFM